MARTRARPAIPALPAISVAIGWPPAEQWFAGRGWQPFDFQRQVWQAMADGRSGLLHATTGAGKTYAVWLGALARAAALGRLADNSRNTPPLGVLWLTPMRALAADTQRALALPMADLAPGWTLGPAQRRHAQRRARAPGPSPAQRPGHHARVADPAADPGRCPRPPRRGAHGHRRRMHEQVGNKRGVQVQLALARLAQWQPGLVVWGLSATLGNLDEAMAMLLPGPVVGWAPPAAALAAQPTAATAPPLVVRGRIDKALRVDTLLPPQPGRFAWGGHLGAQMRGPVAAEIARHDITDKTHPDHGSVLVFTNVRSQAEAWYQMLLDERPDWAGRIALHHGSLDKSVREWVEAGLKDGSLLAVVATSSLDLGVDFLPVARVLQIGSAKGVARLLQRAGRSGHQPGRASRITLVPTNTLELIEAVALRRAIAAGRIEPRHAPDKPLDVLVQHLVTVALGGGFTADALFDEVRRSWSYRALTRDEFQWALDFVCHGGQSLGAYPASTTAWCNATACTGWTTVASPSATGCRWAPSSARPAWW